MKKGSQLAASAAFARFSAGFPGVDSGNLGRVAGFGGGLVVPFMDQNGGAGGEQEEGEQANGVGFGVGELHANNEAFTRSGGGDFVGEQVFNHAHMSCRLSRGNATESRGPCGHPVPERCA